MAEEKDNGPWSEGDEIINVTLPRRDYIRLRKMIQREASLGYAAKFGMTLFLGFAGAALTFTDFFSRIKQFFVGGN